MAKPIFTNCLSLLCLVIFLALKTIHWRREKLDKSGKVRTIIFYVLIIISALETILALVISHHYYIADVMRPLIIAVSFRS